MGFRRSSGQDTAPSGLPPLARDSLPGFPAPSLKQHYQLGTMLPTGEPLERRLPSHLVSSRVNPKATLEVFILDPKGKHSKNVIPKQTSFPIYPGILSFLGILFMGEVLVCWR